MCVIFVKKEKWEKSSVKDQKNALGTNWVRICIKGLIQHKFIIFIKFAIKIGFEYGINSIETADLCDNVRYGSRWIRIVIGLNCVEGSSVSLKWFKIVRVLKDSTTRNEGLSWTIGCGLAQGESLESEGEVPLGVEVIRISLHFVLL